MRALHTREAGRRQNRSAGFDAVTSGRPQMPLIDFASSLLGIHLSVSSLSDRRGLRPVDDGGCGSVIASDVIP